MLFLRRFLRYCLLAASIAPFAAAAAMTQLTANVGQVSDLLSVNGSEVYAATQGGGLYKSTNAGASWARLTALTSMAARPRYINRLAGTDGQVTGSATVYAATTVGVFKTTNSGTSWTQVYGNAAATVAVDPSNINNVLIGVKGIGILRSTNGGTSWAVSGGYDTSDINVIYYQNSTTVWAGFESNNLGGNWGGVWKSTDSGATFGVPAGAGQSPNKYVRAISSDSSNNVYIGTYNPYSGAGGIYKSTSGTGAWTVMTTAVNGGGACGPCPYNLAGIQTLHKDKAVPGRMWAGTGPTGGYSMWRLDAGNWVYAFQTPQSAFSIVGAITTFTGVTDRILAGVNGLGVYLSTNAAATPQITVAASNSGITADRVNALAIPSSGATTIYMGLTGASVMRSTNSGVSFAPLLTGLENVVNVGGTAGGGAILTGYEQIFTVRTLSASPTTATNIYAGVEGRGLYRFNSPTVGAWNPVNDAGLDNSPTSPVPNLIRPRGLFVEADNSVYYDMFEKPDGDGNPANDNAGFYRYNGTSWTRVLAGPWPGNSGAGRFLKYNGAYYALINEDLPYRATAGTGPYTQYSVANVPHLGFARLYFTDIAGNPAALGTIVAATNKGFFKSTDNGLNWAYVPTVAGFSTTNYSAVMYSSTGTLFVGTLDGQIFCSTNNGANYSVKTLPAGWAFSAVTDILSVGTTMYYLTDGNGAWQEASATCP